MKMKNIKYQASPKGAPMCDRKRHLHRKQRTGCDKMGMVDGQSGISNFKDGKVAKKNLKRKVTTINPEDETPTFKRLPSHCDDDVKHRKLVAPEQADVDRTSRTKDLLPQATLSMPSVSSAHQPVASVAETLKKLLYAVKDLFSQVCLSNLL